MGDSLSFFLVVFVFESGVGGEEEEVREEEREALEELGKLDQIPVGFNLELMEITEQRFRFKRCSEN